MEGASKDGRHDGSENTEETNTSENTEETNTSENIEETNTCENTEEPTTSEHTEETNASENTEETNTSENTEETNTSENTEETNTSENTEETNTSENTEETNASESTEETNASENTEETNASENTEEPTTTSEDQTVNISTASFPDCPNSSLHICICSLPIEKRLKAFDFCSKLFASQYDSREELQRDVEHGLQSRSSIARSVGLLSSEETRRRILTVMARTPFLVPENSLGNFFELIDVLPELPMQNFRLGFPLRLCYAFADLDSHTYLRTVLCKPLVTPSIEVTRALPETTAALPGASSVPLHTGLPPITSFMTSSPLTTLGLSERNTFVTTYSLPTSTNFNVRPSETCFIAHRSLSKRKSDLDTSASTPKKTKSPTSTASAVTSSTESEPQPGPSGLGRGLRRRLESEEELPSEEEPVIVPARDIASLRTPGINEENLYCTSRELPRTTQEPQERPSDRVTTVESPETLRVTDSSQILGDTSPRQCSYCVRVEDGRELCDACEQSTSNLTETTYNCPYCSMTFNRSLALAGHLRYHMEEELHQCDLCGNKIKGLVNIKHHVRDTSAHQMWSCDQCNAFFKSQEELSLHKAIYH